MAKSSVHSHREHIAPAIAKAIDAQEVAEGGALFNKVLEVEAEVRRLAQKAERKGDHRGALIGMRELTRILELLGRISGEIKNRVEVNVLVLPQWRDLQERILRALAPYPAARAAVAEALGAPQPATVEVLALPAAPEGGHDA